MPTRTRHLLLAALALGALLILTFALLVRQSRRELQAELRQKIIERPADLLAPIAHLELTDAAPRLSDSPLALLAPVLRSARQQGMLAVSLYEPDGAHLRSIPELPRPALSPADLAALAHATPRPLSRYHPAFRLQDVLAGFPADTEPTPVLEVLVPLQIQNESLGLVRYLIDARPLARELAAVDTRIRRQTLQTIFIGAIAISALLALATWLLHRAGRTLAERNARLLLDLHGTHTLDNHRAHLLCLIAHNLLQNAIAVSAPDSTVTAGLHARPNHLDLTIIDQGPGIPENLRATLFTPGQSARPGGTGLGLALSQLLARQIGATLRLTDTSARGTTFELRLPVYFPTTSESASRFASPGTNRW